MSDVFLQYVTPQGVVMNQGITKVSDVAEVRRFAVQAIQSLISAPNLEDWRSWVLHARDDLGNELFAVPFAALLGKPH